MPSRHIVESIVHHSRVAGTHRVLPPPILTPEEKAREAEIAAMQQRDRLRSAAITRELRENALSVPCREHDARHGQYCWRGAVRGICMRRIDRGMKPWTGPTPEPSRRVSIVPMWRISVEPASPR